MTPPELKPCPFCGRTDVAQGSSGDFISVWCFCGARGPDVPFPEIGDPLPPILECRAAWNTRAAIAALRQPAPAESDRERARKALWGIGCMNDFDRCRHEPCTCISSLEAEFASIRREASLAAANTMMRLQAKSSSKQASDDIAVFRAEAFTAIRNLIDATQPEEPQR